MKENSNSLEHSKNPQQHLSLILYRASLDDENFTFNRIHSFFQVLKVAAKYQLLTLTQTKITLQSCIDHNTRLHKRCDRFNILSLVGMKLFTKHDRTDVSIERKIVLFLRISVTRSEELMRFLIRKAFDSLLSRGSIVFADKAGGP